VVLTGSSVVISEGRVIDQDRVMSPPMKVFQMFDKYEVMSPPI
jgi:hypothetical protein